VLQPVCGPPEQLVQAAVDGQDAVNGIAEQSASRHEYDAIDDVEILQ
jgi:hypothetical protein